MRLFWRSDKNPNFIPFVVENNATLPNIGNIIKMYWDLLNLSTNCSVQKIYESKPWDAFNTSKNLKHISVNSNVRSINKNA
jgi:hypothetical protein